MRELLHAARTLEFSRMVECILRCESCQVMRELLHTAFYSGPLQWFLADQKHPPSARTGVAGGGRHAQRAGWGGGGEAWVRDLPGRGEPKSEILTRNPKPDEVLSGIDKAVKANTAVKARFWNK